MRPTILKPQRQGPTMKDVAQAAGVSSATVSYVLNGLNKVSPSVEAHVRAVAETLGYQRNSLATALKTGRRNVIGFVVPSLLSPVFPEIMRAIQQRAQDHGLATFVVESSRGGEIEAAMTLRRHGVDGAITLLEARPQMTQEPLFPIVVIDRAVDGLDSVMCDHIRGGALMAEAILALGHQRIGLLSGHGEMQSSRARREGLLAGLGGKITPVWEYTVPLEPDLPEEVLEAVCNKSVSLIACVNDVVALGALSALRRAGLRVPEDASVIGFDDMQLSASPLVNLTTIHQPLAEMGSLAVDLLLRRLSDPEASLSNLVLPVKLVERGSTMREPYAAGAAEASLHLAAPDHRAEVAP